MSKSTHTDLTVERVRREGVEVFTPTEVKYKGNPQDFTRFTDRAGRTFYVRKCDAHEVRDIEDCQRFVPTEVGRTVEIDDF